MAKNTKDEKQGLEPYRGEKPTQRDWMALVKKTKLGLYRKFDDDAKVRYLNAICLTGRIGESARAAGVSMEVVRQTRKADEYFGELHDEAMQYYKDLIEAEVHARAIEGWEEPVYQKGELCGYITKKSDKMLELLAKRHIPEYTERMSLNANVSGGVMVIPASAQTDEEWEKQEADKCRHTPTQDPSDEK